MPLTDVRSSLRGKYSEEFIAMAYIIPTKEGGGVGCSASLEPALQAIWEALPEKIIFKIPGLTIALCDGLTPRILNLECSVILL